MVYPLATAYKRAVLAGCETDLDQCRTEGLSAGVNSDDAIYEDRKALPDNHPLMAQERQLIAQTSSFWQAACKFRDAAQERAFTNLYGE